MLLCASSLGAEQVYPGKEVIAAREWTLAGRSEPLRAKVLRWFAGVVDLSLDGRRVSEPEGDFSGRIESFWKSGIIGTHVF